MVDDFVVKEYHDNATIFKFLHLGTNLPVLESFRKYVYWEIDRMNCFTLVIYDESQQIIGHTMLYTWENTLYFAFFYVLNDNFEFTRLLIENIKDQAIKKKSKRIFGPVNLPPYIFGFGFSDVVTDDSPFAMAPTTNPIYIKQFQKCGFFVKQGISTFKIPMIPMKFEKKWDTREADFSKKDEWKAPFLELQQRLYPASIQITPNRANSVDDFIEFIEEFGYNTMILFTYVDNKIIGLGWATPNPFDLDEDGKTKSFVLFGGAVEPEFQKKGIITNTMYYWLSIHAELGITHGESTISDENEAARKLMLRWTGKPTRHHVLMQYELKKDEI